MSEGTDQRFERTCSRPGWPGILAVALSALPGAAIAIPAAEPLPPKASAERDPELVKPHGERLTLDRIFSSSDFREQDPGPLRWSQRSPAYLTLEPPAGGGPGHDLVRTDIAGGAKEVVVAAETLTPPGSAEPLTVEGFEFSHDESRLLVYTNSQRVWRRNTRGDYWALDLPTRRLQKLGGDVPPSTLMFAKFSPDGTRVAYVRENNLYVQTLDGLGITPLTTDGSATLINGTSDWVNEEELDIRDAYRWSPDGRSIAFWQFDNRGTNVPRGRAWRKVVHRQIGILAFRPSRGERALESGF